MLFNEYGFLLGFNTRYIFYILVVYFERFWEAIEGFPLTCMWVETPI
jgi:hypothetical protein